MYAILPPADGKSQPRDPTATGS